MIYPFMQSKISTFFKPSSSDSGSDLSNSLPILDGDDDGLTIWEKTQHQFLNTYKRRAPNPNRNGTNSVPVCQTVKNPNSDNLVPKREPRQSTKTLMKNKKRSYAQYHLELGQSDFLLHSCSTCGVEYAPGDEDDEKAHKEFHKTYTCGIPFRGWCNERIVHMPSLEAGRIVLVLDSDPLARRNKVEEVIKMMEVELGSGWISHKNCKVYMFVSLQRIVGCLVAEPIRKAFKVVSCSPAEKVCGPVTKELKSNPAKLQFGNVFLQREIIRKGNTVENPKVLDMNENGAIVCEKVAVPAVCGIQAIWVTPSNRRKHIALHLLDAARKSFYIGIALERSQLAFSQPTLVGMTLASNYFGTRSFLVYKSYDFD